MTNITQTVLSNGITQSTLPTIYKAPSPETLYSFLYGAANQSKLTSVLLCSKSKDTEVNTLTNSLYKNLQLKLLNISAREVH